MHLVSRLCSGVSKSVFALMWAAGLECKVSNSSLPSTHTEHSLCVCGGAEVPFNSLPDNQYFGCEECLALIDMSYREKASGRGLEMGRDGCFWSAGAHLSTLICPK